MQPLERTLPDGQLPKLQVLGGPEGTVAVGLLRADEPALHPQEVLVGVQRLLGLGVKTLAGAVVRVRPLTSVRNVFAVSGGVTA